MKKYFTRTLALISLASVLLFMHPLHCVASYQALKLTGEGYCSISDLDQKGLNMGLSDFMIEARIKTVSSGSAEQIVSKYDTAPGGYTFQKADSDRLTIYVKDTGGTTAIASSTATISDGQWYYVVAALDRSISTGLKLYIKGNEVTYSGQTDIRVLGSVENSVSFQVGAITPTPVQLWIGQIDEVRIWNFGYGGLPDDYADYIAWRAQGRNVFKDISEYNSGSWNCYADADRTEQVTDGGLENWTDDTPDDWDEEGESAGIRDITKETTIIHSGSAAAKLQATNNDGTTLGLWQQISLVANKYYEATWYSKFSSRTAGYALCWLFNATDDGLVWYMITSVESAYTQHSFVVKPTISLNHIRAQLRNETDTGIAYFDDISVKRVGLVARWRFEGDYTDETVNGNTLTEGGSGNVCGLGYTLKKHKLISPLRGWMK